MAKPLEFTYYLFDWDDNILYMPTVLHYVKCEKGKPGRPAPLTTEKLALDGSDKYTIVEGPSGTFREFSDGGGDFVGDARRAIQYEGFGPSCDAFKAALRGAFLFAIVSARGHAPKTVRQGVRAFIDDAMGPAERVEMKESIKKWLDRAGKPMPADDELIDAYLGGPNGYFGVSFENEKSELSIPELKMNKIKEFVASSLEAAGQLDTEGAGVSVSFGFSDDDRHNLEKMRQVGFFKGLQDEYEYEAVKFFTYGYDADGNWVRRAVPDTGTTS